MRRQNAAPSKALALTNDETTDVLELNWGKDFSKK